jgi:hypothetical protein
MGLKWVCSDDGFVNISCHFNEAIRGIKKAPYTLLRFTSCILNSVVMVMIDINPASLFFGYQTLLELTHLFPLTGVIGQFHRPRLTRLQVHLLEG